MKEKNYSLIILNSKTISIGGVKNKNKGFKELKQSPIVRTSKQKLWGLKGKKKAQVFKWDKRKKG